MIKKSLGVFSRQMKLLLIFPIHTIYLLSGLPLVNLNPYSCDVLPLMQTILVKTFPEHVFFHYFVGKMLFLQERHMCHYTVDNYRQTITETGQLANYHV